MHTSHEYHRFHAQAKMRDLQQQASVHRQLKALEEAKDAPGSMAQVRQFLLVLKAGLVRLIHILKPGESRNRSITRKATTA